MRNPLLAHLGVRLYPDVLDRDACADLADAMRVAGGSASKVYQDGEVGVLDVEVRRSLSLMIDPSVGEPIRHALNGLRPQLEAEYSTNLVCPEGFEYLRYSPGDGFVVHSDIPPNPEAYSSEDTLLRRQVSVVLFVNDMGDDAALEYAGGRLLFQAFPDETSSLADVGFGVEQRAGTLIAFPSRLLHEVSPVTQGQRLTVVGWFLGNDPPG